MSEYFSISVLILLLYIAYQLSRINDQAQWIQFGLGKLLEKQGIEVGRAVEPSPRVKELAQVPGAEVEAIRAYREQTGLGLKEARAVVKALSRTTPSDA